MALNNEISPTNMKVTKLYQEYKSDTIFVDTSFQRRLVWTPKQKVRLIETILIDYPVPEIYLWEQKPDPETGEQKRSVVDGQQRITTLYQFITNQFPLKAEYLDPQHRDEGYSGKFWNELDDAVKQVIWEYAFSVRALPSRISREEIKVIFTRLNETDRSLNPQEFRNARFEGEFIVASEQIAANDFWTVWRVFPDMDRRRMIDIEFASNLLIFLRYGVAGGDDESLNKAYDTYNAVYEKKEEDLTYVNKFLEEVGEMLTNNEKLVPFFRKTIHLYTLFTVHGILKEAGEDVMLYTDKICEFVEKYQNSEDQGQDARLDQYRAGSSYRTNSKSSREKRTDSLLDWISMPKTA